MEADEERDYQEDWKRYRQLRSAYWLTAACLVPGAAIVYWVASRPRASLCGGGYPNPAFLSPAHDSQLEDQQVALSAMRAKIFALLDLCYPMRLLRTSEVCIVQEHLNPAGKLYLLWYS